MHVTDIVPFDCMVGSVCSFLIVCHRYYAGGMLRDVKKNMFFLPLKYFMKYLFFKSFFLKYFILPDTTLPCKKTKGCATVNTVNS